MSLEAVYETYVQYCKRIGVKPAPFEVWVSYAR